MIKQNLKTNSIYTAIVDALEYFEALKDTREETYENRSEAWQDGEKGCEYSDDNNSLQDLVDYLQSAKDELEAIYEY